MVPKIYRDLSTLENRIGVHYSNTITAISRNHGDTNTIFSDKIGKDIKNRH